MSGASASGSIVILEGEGEGPPGGDSIWWSGPPSCGNGYIWWNGPFPSVSLMAGDYIAFGVGYPTFYDENWNEIGWPTITVDSLGQVGPAYYENAYAVHIAGDLYGSVYASHAFSLTAAPGGFYIQNCG